jgi:hypothetical protein
MIAIGKFLRAKGFVVRGHRICWAEGQADVPRGRSKRPFGDDARFMMDLLVACALP